MSGNNQFDPVHATALDLSRLLAQNAITSVEIVQNLLQHIDAHNHQGARLNAVLSIPPLEVLLSQASKLDEERQAGRLRGPLHGIPIMLKDNIITASDMGMPTTVGSYAFANAKATKSASIVEKLINAGLIILGKTNLTEFCGLKKTLMMPGWSSYGGQTQSAYVEGGIVEGELILGHSAPGGSSTGSAVSVAAGFTPLAIGTETVGSVVTPANRSALYALKYTVGALPMDGIFHLSQSFDSLGLFARTATDLALLATALEVTEDTKRANHWRKTPNYRVGFVDPAIWNMSESVCHKSFEADAELDRDYFKIMGKLRERGCTVEFPVQVRSAATLTYNDKPAITMVAFHQFKFAFEDFVGSFTPESCSIRTLADMVRYNEEHKDVALPQGPSDQNDLVNALNDSTLSTEVNEAVSELRHLGGQDGIDRALAAHNVDLIIAPGDSSLCCLAAAAGYPLAMVPLGALTSNGRPYGLCIIAKSGEESKLLRFAAMYELALPERPLPLKPLRRG